MATAKLEGDIKVEVDNMGAITFIAEDGKVCLIYVHSADAVELMEFLIEHGYSFK